MRRNPFRARNISPGRLPYVFPLGHDVDQLLQRFSENDYRGQIVGPHGTGKSTLLVHLTNELKDIGHQVEMVRLEPASSDGRGAAKQKLREAEQLVLQRFAKGTPAMKPIIAVDGLETLPWLERKRFFRVMRQKACGVLVTAHQDLGLPVLWETQVDVERAEKIVAELQRLDELERSPNADGTQTEAGTLNPTVPPELISNLLSRHQGDLREVLFSLYDWYQDHVKPFQ